MSEKFLENTTLIAYSSTQVSKVPCDDLAKLRFDAHNDEVFWLNTYGLNEFDTIKQVVIQTQFELC